MPPEVQGFDAGAGGVFRRVLVGYDGSTDARRALRVGVALAADLGGSVRVLIAIRPPAHVETPEERDRAAEAERTNLVHGLEQAGHQAQGADEISSEVVFADDPALAMAAYAAEHGFDVIVVGGHGREHATHRGMGRSVETLLRHHPCPVLVV